MIEVIYREDVSEDSIHEPRNVKQIGSVDPKYRIYMEDTVLTSIRKSTTAENEVHFGLLLGELKRAAGTTYLFIRGMVRAAGKRNESENVLSGRLDRDKYRGLKRTVEEKKKSGEKREAGEKRETGKEREAGEKRAFEEEKEAVEKRVIGEERGAEEKKAFEEEREAVEKRETGEERRAVEKRVFEEERETGEKRVAGKKREAEEEREAVEKREAGEKRETGEKRGAGEKRETEEERNIREERGTGEKRDAGVKLETAEKRKTDERRRSGEKNETAGNEELGGKYERGERKEKCGGTEEEKVGGSDREKGRFLWEVKKEMHGTGSGAVALKRLTVDKNRGTGDEDEHQGSSAIPLIDFDGETWSRLYEDINHWFPDMEILGWYASFPFLNVSEFDLCREIHYTHFSGADKVLFLCDRIEHEETFYRPDGAELRETEGYFTFFEKNGAMLKYQQENEPADGSKETEQAEVERRSIRQGTVGEAPRRKWNLSVASILVTVALLAAVLVVNQYNRHLEENLGSADGSSETETTAVQALAVDGQVLDSNMNGDGAENGNADGDGAGTGNADGDGAGTGNADGDGAGTGNADGDGAEKGNADGDGAGDGNTGGDEAGDGNADGDRAGTGNADEDGAGDEKDGEGAGNGNTDGEETEAGNADGAGTGNTDEDGAGTGKANGDGAGAGNTDEDGAGIGKADGEETEAGNADGDGTEAENVSGDGAGNGSADGEETGAGNADGDGTGNTGTATTSGNGGTSLEDETVQTGSRVSARYYTVKSGETLYSICMDVYKTSAMVEIVRVLNDIGEDYVIQEGQKILLP